MAERKVEVRVEAEVEEQPGVRRHDPSWLDLGLDLDLDLPFSPKPSTPRSYGLS